MMSSMLLRASRVAARAAFSAVSAAPDLLLPRSTPVASPLFGRYLASRRTAVACLGGAGAQDLLLRRSTPVASPPFGRCLSSHMARSNQGAPAPVGSFVFDGKDLESDEALWALYERWCKFWGEERSREEMQHCFDEFKDCARLVHRVNKNGGGGLELNMFADGKESGGLKFADREKTEKRPMRVPREIFDRLPNSKRFLMGSAGHNLDNNKGSKEEDFIDILV